MEQKNIERQVAIKTTIQELVLGQYMQEGELVPNYILTPHGKKIHRVNILAVLIKKELQGNITIMHLDDGSGKIPVYIFEENSTVQKLQPGDILLIIGKLRIYNLEKYISPEIIKKLSPLWLKVRALELPRLAFSESSPPKLIGEVEEETVENSSDKRVPVKKILQLIKELDQGNGVLVEDLITKSYVKDTEQWIQTMLENGDIFQNLPGKVKVL